MDEAKREPSEEKKRLTREDVLRLIEEHGGPEGLDLERADLREADLGAVDLHEANLFQANLQGGVLRGTNLQGANLFWANLQEAFLVGAKLQGANLQLANLQEAFLVGANLQGADLGVARLQGADLHGADLQKANLRGANLQGADLHGADLRRARLAHANLREANLEDANWGDYKLGEEIERDFRAAASVYRALKQRHTEAGMYDLAGEFHYREMEAQRKLAWKERRLPYASAMYLLRFLYGYGERPERVIGWAAAVILGLALVHWLFGTVSGGFLDALYYSAVSFTALGYGGWVDQSPSWAARFLGVGESLLGVFMMALFLVTFTRKMTR